MLFNTELRKFAEENNMLPSGILKANIKAILRFASPYTLSLTS